MSLEAFLVMPVSRLPVILHTHSQSHKTNSKNTNKNIHNTDIHNANTTINIT